MALDSNFLDDSAPNADAVSALRPKRKRIKPWQELPVTPDQAADDRAQSSFPTADSKYGQPGEANSDRAPPKYGHEGSNTDTKYGQGRDGAAANSDKRAVKYGQAQPNTPITGPDVAATGPQRTIRQNAPLAEDLNQIRTREAVPIYQEPCPDLNQGLSVIDLGLDVPNTDKPQGKGAHVRNTMRPSPDLKIQTDMPGKYGHPESPPSPQKLLILELLYADQEATGLGHTRMLSTTWIAQSLDLSLLSVRKQLDRMKAEGRIERLNGRRGRGAAGCIYQVSPSECSALKSRKYRQLKSANADTKYGQGEGLSDSSSRSLSLKETTTKRGDRLRLIEELGEWVERFDVDPKFRVDGNDIAGWWDKVEKTHDMTLDEFQESFERWVFKVSSSPIRDGVDPKGVLAARILTGPCGMPVGFVSWQDKRDQEMERFRAERIQSARRRALAEYEGNFDIWFEEAPDEEILQGLPEDARRGRRPAKGKKLVRSIPLRALVREGYAAQAEIDLEHWNHLKEQLQS